MSLICRLLVHMSSHDFASAVFRLDQFHLMPRLAGWLAGGWPLAKLMNQWWQAGRHPPTAHEFPSFSRWCVGRAM